MPRSALQNMDNVVEQQQQPSRKKPKIMGASGQTDEDRRALRHNLRLLQKEISAKAEQMENPTSGVFEQVREKSNGLFAKVKYTREAVLDGDNVEAISAHAARQVDRLVQVPRYDSVRLTQKLVQKCRLRGGGFDWVSLGREAGACFNAIPSRVAFLSGPLSAEYVPKTRKARAPRIVESDEASEEEPDEQTRKEKTNANQLSAVERNMKVLSKTLNKRCHASFKAKKQKLDQQAFASDHDKKRAEQRLKKHGYDISAMQYLLNPNSFTQTVENLFHFSFLVKKGDAKIHVDPQQGPMVRAVKDQTRHGEERQAVIAFTMKDWRALCEAYHVTKGDIPDRSAKKRSRDASSPSIRDKEDSNEGDSSD